MRTEQDDWLIYELGARSFAAGFGGESRPRCVLTLPPASGTNGTQHGGTKSGQRARRDRQITSTDEEWGCDHELYRTDAKALDLGTVEDILGQLLRQAHTDYLQLDPKPRKAVLITASLLPTSLLEAALRVLFTHFMQPPIIMLMTAPVLACVGAGLRDGLVIDLGWEESIITVVGEYKEIVQRRTTRAGKMMTREVGKVLEREIQDQDPTKVSRTTVSFQCAEDIAYRLAWCRPLRDQTERFDASFTVPHPLAPSKNETIRLDSVCLCEPVESTLLPAGSFDDHELSIPLLAYQILLSLETDLRAHILSRIVVTGGLSNIPGLKHRLLQEIATIVDARGWNPVFSYGSATGNREKLARERTATKRAGTAPVRAAIHPVAHPEKCHSKPPDMDSLPASERLHDHLADQLTFKTDREVSKGRTESVYGFVRGVHSLGAWAGASLMAATGTRATKEIERDDFIKNGLWT